MKRFTPLLLFILLFHGCSNIKDSVKREDTFQLNIEKYTLDNGLQVIFHIDRSDPVVAVALTAHVGSAREKVGRTGFAHLFEHLLFLESENLGKGGLDKLSARIGGSGANGSTDRDWTNYYQTVPADALEKMLWAEADKLGYFINTVSEQVLAKEKEVVKNEKRQRNDNEPYGHTDYVIDKNLYPENHPYHWQVIGSLEDLQNATLADVKEFFKSWYVPNNVTLSISGDFDPQQAKAWVKKYFDEIKSGPPIPPVEKRAVTLNATKKLFHEDNFANVPELTMAWPGVHAYHPDAFALDILTRYLSEGKKAPLYKVLVAEKQLTSRVRFFQYNTEIAGQALVSVRTYPDIVLDTVLNAITETFSAFAKTGIAQADLDRIRAGREVDFYNSISSVEGKGIQLAEFNLFAGDPAFINEYADRLMAVTTEDVMRVFNQYIKEKNFVATSFVPKGRVALALGGSVRADVVEEPIVEGAEDEFDASEKATYERTASSFDRSVEPPYGKAPETKVPKIWKDSLANGLRVLAITNNEVPMVQFSMRIDGGLYLDDVAKVGVANLVGEMLNKGTKNKTAEEFEEAIQKLGAQIRINVSDQSLTITGSTLARNYDALMSLLTEMLLEPRWDDKELLLARQRVLSQIREQRADPNAIASAAFRRLIYGNNHILANNFRGTEISVGQIGMNDLQRFFKEKMSPERTSLHVVGDLTKEAVMESLKKLSTEWKPVEVQWPAYASAKAPEKSKVYFYDIPDAKQSVIRLGYPALAATDPDFYPVQVMNFILGGGGFASRLTQELRESKGYTYGINSWYSGTKIPGPFTISSGVRTNVTLEATEAARDVVSKFGATYSEADLEVTRSSLIKSNARAFETGDSKVNMLTNISAYGWPDDYLTQREKIVNEMTVEKIRSLSSKYLRPDQMYYVIAGDAKSQAKRMSKLGFGEPIVIGNERTDQLQ